MNEPNDESKDLLANARGLNDPIIIPLNTEIEEEDETPAETPVEEVKEETPEESKEDQDAAKAIDPSEYREISNMVKEMEEWNKTLSDFTINSLKNDYGLDPQCLLKVSVMSYEEIDKMPYEDIKKFFDDYRLDKNTDYNPNCADNYDDAHNDMRDIKKSQLDLLETSKEIDNIKKESNEVLDDMINYMYSPKVVEMRQKRLADMKALAAKETDETKKNKILRMIDTMEKNNTMGFIFDRMKSYGKKEVINIMTGFFKDMRGNYVIERFNSKVPKFGFDPNIYKSFFNLEENFLPEEYHPFNNIFLFNYMRFVAYSDPYNKEDKLFVQRMTSAMAGLIYHRYNNVTLEENFINIVKKFDDNFMEYKDFFYENNTTRPNHPVRVQQSAKMEADRKNEMIRLLKEINVTDYDENMSSKELAALFNERYKEYSEAASKKLEEETPEEEVVDESIVTEIPPKDSEEKPFFQDPSKMEYDPLTTAHPLPLVKEPKILKELREKQENAG